MKLEKVSNYVLYALSTLIVLSFVAFFTIGYDNPEGDRNAPQLTGFLLFLQYALGLGGFLLLAWSVFVSARQSAGTDEIKATGLPGSKIVLFTTLLTIAALAVGFVIGFGEEDFTTVSGVFTSAAMMQVVDTFMWGMYILGFVAIVALALSASGVFAQKIVKK